MEPKNPHPFPDKYKRYKLSRCSKMKYFYSLLCYSAFAACTLRPGPICSTDRIVFADECLLNAAKKTYSQALNNGAACSNDRTWFRNECFLIKAGKVRNVNLTPYLQKCFSCNLTSGPVCGTNGVKYANTCALKYNNQTRSSTLAVVNGACQTRPCANSGAVCSVDGKVYSNQCLLEDSNKVLSNVLVANNGVCEVPFPCEDVQGRFCGVDGKLYDSKCALEYANQKESTSLWIVNDVCKPPMPPCTLPATGPFCTVSGAPLSNQCELSYYEQTASTTLKVFSGSCYPSAPKCNQTSGAVCSATKKLYPNECALATAGERLSSAYIPYKNSCLICDINSGYLCSAGYYTHDVTYTPVLNVVSTYHSGQSFSNHCELVFQQQEYDANSDCNGDAIEKLHCPPLESKLDAAYKAYTDCTLGRTNSNLDICKVEYYRYSDAYDVYEEMQCINGGAYATMVRFNP